jgi:hypothetical protein
MMATTAAALMFCLPDLPRWDRGSGAAGVEKVFAKPLKFFFGTSQWYVPPYWGVFFFFFFFAAASPTERMVRGLVGCGARETKG